MVDLYMGFRLNSSLRNNGATADQVATLIARLPPVIMNPDPGGDSLLPQNTEWFLRHHFPVRKNAHRHDQQQRRRYSYEIDRGNELPGSFYAVLAVQPRQRNRGGRASHAGQKTEYAVFDERNVNDQLLLRAQRLEDRRFVEAMNLGHRHRAGQDQHTAEDDEGAEEIHGERDVIDLLPYKCGIIIGVKRQNVREAIDQLSL